MLILFRSACMLHNSQNHHFVQSCLSVIFSNYELYFIQLFSADTTKYRKYLFSYLVCPLKHKTIKWNTLAFVWQFQYCPMANLPRHKKVQGSFELFGALLCSYVGFVVVHGPKVQSVLQPCSAPLVPLICSPIFAKRSWRFEAQELENV